MGKPKQASKLGDTNEKSNKYSIERKAFNVTAKMEPGGRIKFYFDRVRAVRQTEFDFFSGLCTCSRKRLSIRSVIGLTSSVAKAVIDNFLQSCCS